MLVFDYNFTGSIEFSGADERGELQAHVDDKESWRPTDKEQNMSLTSSG